MQIRRIETVKIVSIYTIFGVAWIYGSDTAVGWLVRDPEIIVKIAVSKGSFFIFFTATLLYFLISRFVQQLAVAERGRLESLKNYQAIFNATNEAILIHDAHNGSIVDVNGRMLEMFGYGRDEALTREIWQLSAGVSPYSQEEAVEKVRRAMLEEPQVFEWLSRKKNGELFWSEVSLKKVVTGGCDRIVAVLREISERKQAEEAVREREQFLQTILQTTADGFWVLNAEGRFVEVNNAYCDMSGYSKQELAGLHINDIEADETPNQTAERIQRISARGTDFFETHHRRKDASVFPLEVSVSFTKERGGQYVCFCRDLTERKRTEEALHATLRRTQIILSNMHAGILLVNNDNQIDFVNQSFCELFDLEETPTNLLGMSAAAMRTITPGVFDEPQAALVRIQEIIAQDQVIKNEQVSIRGKRTYLRDYIPLVVEEKKYGRLWHYLDITERKRAEEKLQESEERFKALHNASFGGITIHDKGLILECNQGLSQITGYPVEELIGMDGLTLIAPSSRELVMNNILAGYEKPYEALGIRKNGEEYPLRLEARMIPYQGRTVRTVEFRDITEYKQYEAERERMQQQLAQAQKMESVGPVGWWRGPRFQQHAGGDSRVLGTDPGASGGESAVPCGFARDPAGGATLG